MLGGGVLASGPLQTMLAGAVGAAPPDRFRVLEPAFDQRGDVVRLHLPPGFQYKSFHDTEATVTLHDGTVLPGRHDGMAAFNAPNGNVWLVRNHEVNGPVPAFGPGAPYDTMTGGGGADIFRFRDDWGIDTVTDFEVGVDKIRMNEVSDLFDGFDGLSIVQDGANTVVTLVDDDTYSIMLLNVDASLVSESDFIL